MYWPIVVIAGSWPIELSRLFMLQCRRRGRSSPAAFMTRHLSAFLRRIEITCAFSLMQNFIPIDAFQMKVQHLATADFMRRKRCMELLICSFGF
jgi:hypothetical protein